MQLLTDCPDAHTTAWPLELGESLIPTTVACALKPLFG
jgi:hypothetical protein